MGLGLGIFLLVIGAIFIFAIHLPENAFISGQNLGYVLLFAGILVIVLSFVVGAMRRRTRVVTETQRPGQQPVVSESQTINNSPEL